MSTKNKKPASKPPFKVTPEAKILLSKWILSFMGENQLDEKEMESLVVESLSHILSEPQIRKLKNEDFRLEMLEEMLHNCAG